jgi:hypothetical protein
MRRRARPAKASPMKTLVVIYGPPAVGKLTVGRLVAERAGLRLFHNHLAVDLALSLFDFGTRGFRALRAAVWRTAFDAALAEGIKGLVFTFNPEPSVDRDFIPDLIRRTEAAGGRVLLVSLTAPDAVLTDRVDAPSRRGTGKLVDRALFSDLLARGVFDVRGMPPAHLTLDTSAMTAEAAAGRIVEALA